MEIGINRYLQKLSSDLFIKRNSDERSKIDTSVTSIVNKIDSYFGDEVDEIIVFGSYTRDTILPRNCDPNSDIDIMIQFSDKYEKLKPESYRNKLKKFAETHYKNSAIIKDHPSIVIELNHIKFDLVPAIFDDGFFYDSIEIPSKDGGWMETEPNEFNTDLTNANTKYNSIVKPIIRLLKYWNASQDYPYASFELETLIADMDFSNDTHESGFLYAITKLSNDSLSGNGSQKLKVLRENGEWIKEYLERGNLNKAKEVLHRMLPHF